MKKYGVGHKIKIMLPVYQLVDHWADMIIMHVHTELHIQITEVI